MPHSVTVTRTTTTTSTSAILLNIGYFKKPPGILKLLHVILGVITVGILGYYAGNYFTRTGYFSLYTPELFFLLMATTCLIASTLLLFACFISIASATILPKTIFEVLFHGFATIFLLIGAAIYTAKLHEHGWRDDRTYSARLAAGEVVHLPVYCFLLLVASVNCMGHVISRNSMYVNDSILAEPGYVGKIIASVIGLVNSVLYGAATYLSYKAYKTG